MNKRHGEGILNTIDGLSYQGTFLDNQLQGSARVYDQVGGCFEGEWDKGVNNKMGTYTTASGHKQNGC